MARQHPCFWMLILLSLLLGCDEPRTASSGNGTSTSTDEGDGTTSGDDPLEDPIVTMLDTTTPSEEDGETGEEGGEEATEEEGGEEATEEEGGEEATEEEGGEGATEEEGGEGPDEEGGEGPQEGGEGPDEEGGEGPDEEGGEEATEEEGGEGPDEEGGEGPQEGGEGPDEEGGEGPDEEGGEGPQEEGGEGPQEEGGEEATGPNTYKAFLAVHMEPGQEPATVKDGEKVPNFKHPMDYWPALQKLVTAANEADVKLTLMFSPQWGAYVQTPFCSVEPEAASGQTPPPTCLEWVHFQQSLGHEIALRHHPVTAPTWDGYSDDPTLGNDPDFLGNLEGMMAEIEPLSADGNIVSSTTEEFPPTILYNAAGGKNKYQNLDEPGDLVSTPCKQPGHEIWQIRMRQFTSETAQMSVLDEELPAFVQTQFLSDQNEQAVLGFVTHAQNVKDTDIARYKDLFVFLQEFDIKMVPVAQAIGEFGYTTSNGPIPMSFACEEENNLPLPNTP